MPAVQANGDDAQLLALLGSAYMKSGDTAKGAELLEQASELDPKAASILTQLALSHLVSGSTTKAIAELESAVELNPDLVQADILLILSHLRNKNYDAALEAGRNLSNKQPKSPLPFNLIGAAYIGKGDLSGAREYFELALKSHPDFTPAMVNLFSLDIQEGKQEDAQNRIEDILKIDPKNAQALIAKARFAAEAGNNAESLQLLESARSENPSAFKPRLLLGRFYTARNDPGNALTIARELEAIAPENPDTQLLLGQALRLNRQFDEAHSLFKKLAEAYPEVPEVLYQLAYSTTQAGDAAEGRRIFEKIIQAQPNHLRAILALANLDIRDEKFSDAMKHAVNIQTSYPARPEGKVVEADVLLAEKKFAEAIATYQEAYKIKPSTGLAIKIAQIQKNNADTKGAIATLDSRIAENPQDLGIRLAKATIQQEAGSTEPAIQGYEAVLKIDENNVVALNNLSWIYQQAGNPKALDLAQKAYNLASDSPAVADTFGWILVLNDKVEQGLVLLQKAIKAAPDAPDIRYHMAAALAKSGQKNLAIRELETALASKAIFTERKEAENLLKSLQ
jgi:putative PEP-CTERM system TPR-repeat lipoprotein